MVLKEIQDLSWNSSAFTPALRYRQGRAGSFGGNFSAQNRFSYFGHLNGRVGVPCGFLKKFPINDPG